MSASRLRPGQIPATYGIQGGLDLVTPPLFIKPGRLINGNNYEPVEKGIARMDGFERFDGRPKPSSANYWLMNYVSGTATIATAATVTGATSGATGTALIDMVVSSGSFGGSNAAGYLVLYNVVGTFVTGENLQVAAVTKCVSSTGSGGVAVHGGASTDADDSTWMQDAIVATRAAIQTVPGSGAMRGVWYFNGAAYAFRDNAGATACVMFKSSTAGWVAQSLGVQLKFQTGSAAIAEGNVVVGATSGATGTVTRLVLRTGAWSTGDAAGQLVFASVTGTFQNGENLQVAAATKAVANGVNAAITLPAGGRYEFANYNFYGASNLFRMYGCNGVGTAFEWDGSVFAPILTGMTADTPNHLAVHKNQLILAFPGGSVQTGGVGDPHAWTVVLGASEIGMGSDVTGFCEDFNFVLGIFCRDKIKMLYGSAPIDWDLRPLSEDTGALAWTVQKFVNPYYFDDRGMRDITTTQAYGDFKLGLKSQLIDPLIQYKKKNGATPIASLRCKTKGQYRVYYDDGTGIACYLGRKLPEFIPFNLGKTVRCCSSSEDSSGNEIMLMGSDDGYVYELDKGTSLDGTEIEAYARLVYNNVGGVTRNKRWHSATVEVDASPSISLGMLAEYDYGNPDQPSSSQQNFTVQGSGGYWNIDDWNQFYWSAPVRGRAFCKLYGKGVNVSVAVVSRATYEQPHTITGITLHYSWRGLVRLSA